MSVDAKRSGSYPEQRRNTGSRRKGVKFQAACTAFRMLIIDEATEILGYRVHFHCLKFASKLH